MHVLVLAGGTSDEREVSLRSGQAVARALQQSGHKTTLYDPMEASDSLSQASRQCDVVFIALHGAGGEDGTVQQQLKRTNTPYVGSDVYASELCFDKWNYRALLTSHDIPMARGVLVDRETFWQSELIQQPFVLKPPKGGSSIDTILVHHPSQPPRMAMEAVFDKYNQLLMETLAPGTEITAGILDDQALPIIEIIPPAGADFDYENKYNGTSQELCPPQHVSEEVQERARQLATRIHHLCSCRDMSRTDMIVGPDGSLTVLETNTIPGLTEQSLLPKAVVAAGITIPVFCDGLVQAALARATTQP